MFIIIYSIVVYGKGWLAKTGKPFQYVGLAVHPMLIRMIQFRLVVEILLPVALLIVVPEVLRMVALLVVEEVLKWNKYDNERAGLISPFVIMYNCLRFFHHGVVISAYWRRIPSVIFSA